MRLDFFILLWLLPALNVCGVLKQVQGAGVNRIVNVSELGAKGDGKHDDFEFVDRALRIAMPGDSVLFPRGVYAISQTLKTYQDEVTLIFRDQAIIVSKHEDVGLLWIRNSGCIVSGGIFKGNGKTSSDFYKGYGILLTGVSDCIIKECRFEDISGNGILLLPKGGKIGVTNNSILNNTIIYSPVGQQTSNMAAIMIGYSGSGYVHKNNTVQGNFIDGGKAIGHGIGVFCHAKNTMISGNIVKNCLRYGIVAYQTANVDSTLTRTYVLDNRIDHIGSNPGLDNGMGMGIYLMKSHHSVVRGNIVTNCLQNAGKLETLMRGAIAINGSVYCEIEDNFIRSSGKYGIAGAYCFSSNIRHNTIKGTQKDGIRLINTNGNLVDSNVLEDIGGTGFSAYFGNTSFFLKQRLLDQYEHIETGDNITFSNNIIECKNPKGIRILGDKRSVKLRGRRKIEMSIYNNTFIGNFDEESFLFLKDVEMQGNKVRSNFFEKE